MVLKTISPGCGVRASLMLFLKGLNVLEMFLSPSFEVTKSGFGVNFFQHLPVGQVVDFTCPDLKSTCPYFVVP